MDMFEKKDYLIVVDMQNDFVTGALGSAEAQAIVPEIANMIKDYCCYDNSEIIFTRDTHYDNYLDTQEGKNLPVPHCVKDTEGWQVIDELRFAVPANKNALYIDKESFGYTEWTDYISAEDVKAITLCGVCTDICVVSNALILKALYPEVPISVVSPCCAGVTPEKHAVAIETMRSCQINIV